MSYTLDSLSYALPLAELTVPANRIGAPEEDFMVRTQAFTPALEAFPEARTMMAPAPLPSTGTMFRAYTPPPAGSFDPLTAAITGGIPSFFRYRRGDLGTVTPVPEGGRDTSVGEGGGEGGGSDGGLGSGNVNMGGEMAGSIDLGPNPGNLGSGTLGNLSNIDLSNVSLSGGLRGAGLGGMLGGPFGAVLGGLAGAFGPAISDARDRQETARAHQTIHDRAVEAMLSDLEAQDSKGLGDISPDQGPTAGDKSGPGVGGEKGGVADAEAAAEAAAAAAEAAAADAAAADAAADAGAGDSGDSDSDSGGGDSGGDSGGGDGGGGDGGYYQGGLVQFARGGVVPLQGGGKIAIGPGGGLDDLIPTSINGRQAAALSDGEFVIPADVVSMMGDGSSNAGARRLYDLVRQVRDNKTGTTRQAGPLPVGEILKRSLGR